MWHCIAFLIILHFLKTSTSQPYEAIDTDNFMSRRLASQSYAPRPRESQRPEIYKVI